MPSRTVRVGSRGGLHARPAALFVAAAAAAPVPVAVAVAGRRPVPARSMLSVLSLAATYGTEVTLSADGEGAEAVLESLAELLARDLDAEPGPDATSSDIAGFGPPAGEPVAPEPGPTEPATGAATTPRGGTATAPTVCRGIGVSPGRVAGPILRLGAVPELPPPARVTDPGAEADRALAALRGVQSELERRASEADQSVAAAVLHAQSAMAGDPELAAAVVAAAGSGQDAAHALHAAFGAHQRTLAAAGGYLAERVADLVDVRDRAVAACLGRPMPGVPNPGHPFILLARDLAPADTVGLPRTPVLGLVTEVGGPTSHTAILARALGIPAVVSCADVLALEDGAMVHLDGSAGLVTVGVDEEQAAAVRVVHQRRSGSAARIGGPGRTADGHPVALLANVGSARDLAAVPDVEGIGLFRTELLYLGHATAPSLADQAAAYGEVFAAMAGRRVVVRTLDAGADKPLPFVALPDEPNPALGLRGLRVARRHPELLRTQLRAIAEAAQQADAQVAVMAPMVATEAEAAGFVRECRSVGLTSAGVMVEIPAAALRARSLVAAADFLSIGTNDLSQYAFAADRQCGDLAELLDPWQPALLALIAACASAGREAGKPVGVCGEAAADPALAVVLVGLGVSSLSMSAAAIPAVRERLAAHPLAECRRLAELALADAPAARSALT